MIFMPGRSNKFPFMALFLVWLLFASCVHSQASSRKKNIPLADEYTKRLVKEMQNQGVPKEAIVNRIKHTTNGETNAKKVIEHIDEEKRKQEAIAKQRRKIGSKPKTLEQKKNKRKYGRNEL